MKNPFRTKKIIIAQPEKNIFIEIPFFGKIRFKQEKTELRGYKINSVIIDEINEIPDKNWKIAKEKK